MDEDILAEINYYVAEAELAIVKDEPRSAELQTHIKPSTLKRLEEYCQEHNVSGEVIASTIVEEIIAEFLYQQGY